MDNISSATLKLILQNTINTYNSDKSAVENAISEYDTLLQRLNAETDKIDTTKLDLVVDSLPSLLTRFEASTDEIIRQKSKAGDAYLLISEDNDFKEIYHFLTYAPFTKNASKIRKQLLALDQSYTAHTGKKGVTDLEIERNTAMQEACDVISETKINNGVTSEIAKISIYA